MKYDVEDDSKWRRVTSSEEKALPQERASAAMLIVVNVVMVTKEAR